ncbi:MAG: hypothetical protein FJ255_12580 [Phycisphaerae bacterium]|nr:hypothetical protein [Phycisphaerae bacterium]
MTMRTQECPIRRLSPRDGGHYFFGYYDRCPWSADQGLVLAHRAEFCDRAPGPADRAAIGVLEGNGSFRRLDATSAWNWQQGAQLAWIPGSPNLVFNVRVGAEGLGARILSPDGVLVGELAHPVAALSPAGGSALTLTFARLTARRPEYGYAGLTDPSVADPAPGSDGVYRLDLRSGRRELLVSIRALVEHRPSPWAGPGTVHHVNHPLYNRAGTRFCFMQRFVREGGIQHSRLFTLGADGSDLRLLFEGFVSHYDWLDDTTIVAWAGRRRLLGGKGGSMAGLARRSLKAAYHALGKPRFLMSRVMKDSYLLFPDREGAEPAALARGDLTTDGHCTRSPDGRWLLTDGYPDRGRQPLFLWDLRTGAGVRVGRYASPALFDGPIRVDLHPRFSRDGRAVCIDSAMDGSRAMYAVDVSSITAP